MLPGLFGSRLFGQPVWTAQLQLRIPANLPGLYGAYVFGQPVWTPHILASSSQSANMPGWVGSEVFGQPVWLIAGYTPTPVLGQTFNFTGVSWIILPNDQPYHTVVKFIGVATVQR